MLKEKIQEVIAKSEEQFIAEQQSKKIVNKGYRLVDDLKIYPPGMEKIVNKWIDEKRHETATKEEWSAGFEKEMKTIAKKGDIFFRSKIYHKDGIYHLYPSNASEEEVFRERDISLGLGMAIEKDRFKLWEMYLGWNYYYYDDGKFEEIEINELTFEQIHLREYFNHRKNKLTEEMLGLCERMDILNDNINFIN